MTIKQHGMGKNYADLSEKLIFLALVSEYGMHANDEGARVSLSYAQWAEFSQIGIVQPKFGPKYAQHWA